MKKVIATAGISEEAVKGTSVSSVVLGAALKHKPEGNEHGDEETIEDDGEGDLSRHIAIISIGRISR